MQQSKRQARYRQWAGTTSTFNGDKISAGQLAAGIKGLTYNEALMYICRSIAGNVSDNLPGLEAAAAEVLQVPGGWDSVGDELPLQAWDFTSGGVFSNLSYGTNVSGAVSRDSLVYRNAGEARSSSLGLLCEPQKTNKCTDTNMKPTDTSGTTPDAVWTTHEAVALSALPSEVLNALPEYTTGKLTHVYHSISNGAGIITVSGVTGNTNPHCPSVWHYTVSGDFGCGLSNLGPSPEPELGEWRRHEKPGTPGAATDTLVVGSTQASEAYWFGDQLEEGTAASNTRSSLIETNGAAATRLGDNVRVATPSGLNTASFVCVVQFSNYANPDTGILARTVQFDSGNDTAGQILYGMVRVDTVKNQLRDDGTLTLDTGIDNVLGVDQTQAFGMDGAGNATMSVDGGAFQSAAYTPQSSYSLTRFGSRFNATNQPYGYIKRVAIYDRPATQANVQQLSAG